MTRRSAGIEYRLYRTSGRRITCHVEPEGVRLYVPKGMSDRQADAYIAEKAALIVETIQKIRKHAALAREKAAQPVGEGCHVVIEGVKHALRLEAGAPGVRQESGEIIVSGTDGSEGAVTGAVRGYLIELAKTRFAERVRYFSERVGKTPGRITIRDQKTKWGSCSSLGNLNFNWQLIVAPPHILDYIVVHELCHMHEMNHSKRFWQRVSKHVPDYAARRDWLAGWTGLPVIRRGGSPGAK